MEKERERGGERKRVKINNGLFKIRVIKYLFII
jgi:hypothetical protein